MVSVMVQGTSLGLFGSTGFNGNRLLMMDTDGLLMGATMNNGGDRDVILTKCWSLDTRNELLSDWIF